MFNQLSDGMEIKGEVPWNHPSKFWRDADDAQLISYIDLNYGNFSARNYDIAVSKVTDDRSYHPIKEFLAALPEWDEIPRVNTLLVDFLGAADNAYVRAVTRKTLVAAIARVMNPGCKFDTMLVLLRTARERKIHVDCKTLWRVVQRFPSSFRHKGQDCGKNYRDIRFWKLGNSQV